MSDLICSDITIYVCRLTEEEKELTPKVCPLRGGEVEYSTYDF